MKAIIAFIAGLTLGYLLCTRPRITRLNVVDTDYQPGDAWAPKWTSADGTVHVTWSGS